MHIYYSNMNTTNWDGFRYFIAAVEGGSLTAAAKRLGSNQPTVGRQIDALESALGIKLFQRSVKGLILTEEGAFVYEQAQSMQSFADKIQRYRQGGDKAISGTVRIALPEGLCLEVITPKLALFYNDYPHINLILNVSSNTANLTRGEADIAIRLFRPKEANLVVKHLGQMPLGLYACSDYLKTFGCPADLEALRQHHIITYADQLSTLAENQWLVEHSSASKHVLSSDSTLTRLKATLCGIGISIQPTLFARTNPDLVPVLSETVLPSHEVWMAYHKDLRYLARIRTVINFITDILKLDTSNSNR